MDYKLEREKLLKQYREVSSKIVPIGQERYGLRLLKHGTRTDKAALTKQITELERQLKLIGMRYENYFGNPEDLRKVDGRIGGNLR